MDWKLGEWRAKELPGQLSRILGDLKEKANLDRSIGGQLAKAPLSAFRVTDYCARLTGDDQLLRAFWNDKNMPFRTRCKPSLRKFLLINECQHKSRTFLDRHSDA